MRRALRLALGLGLGLGLVLAQFSVARAHAILLSAAPNPNGFFPTEAPPAQVQINFREEVAQAFSDIQVLDAAGELMTVGDMRTNNANRTSLAVELHPLPPRSYTVAWRVLSDADGHTSSGSFAFGVGVTPTGRTVVSPPTVSATSFVNR